MTASLPECIERIVCVYVFHNNIILKKGHLITLVFLHNALYYLLDLISIAKLEQKLKK